MVDFAELMRFLSIPRPNGSTAEKKTAQALCDWLGQRQIAFRIHKFRLNPYLTEEIGIWTLFSSTLLMLSLVLRWRWLALAITPAALMGAYVIAETGVMRRARPFQRLGQNILIERGSHQARQEIVLAAHYDSKTELFDHRVRALLVKALGLGIGLVFAIALVQLADRSIAMRAQTSGDSIYWIGICLGVAMLLPAWGVGLNLVLGRVIAPSQGAVDNGTACAILLGLAARLARHKFVLRHTKVTIALFAGEEAGMQGSSAYVQSREWPLPTVAVNMELMAQDGDYVLWKYQGKLWRRLPTSSMMNTAVADAVKEITGKSLRFVKLLHSDGYSLLQAGIPTSVLGTYHSQLQDTGFHRPTDNLERVAMARLPEAVKILEHLIQTQDERSEKGP